MTTLSPFLTCSIIFSCRKFLGNFENGFRDFQLSKKFIAQGNFRNNDCLLLRRWLPKTRPFFFASDRWSGEMLCNNLARSQCKRPGRLSVLGNVGTSSRLFLGKIHALAPFERLISSETRCKPLTTVSTTKANEQLSAFIYIKISKQINCHQIFLLYGGDHLESSVTVGHW